MGAVAAALMHEGEVPACRALLQLQIMISREDREPLQMLVRDKQCALDTAAIQAGSALGRMPGGRRLQIAFRRGHGAGKEGLLGRNRRATGRLGPGISQPSRPCGGICRLSAIGWPTRTVAVEALRKYAALDVTAGRCRRGRGLGPACAPSRGSATNTTFSSSITRSRTSTNWQPSSRPASGLNRFRSTTGPSTRTTFLPKTMFVLVDRLRARFGRRARPA